MSNAVSTMRWSQKAVSVLLGLVILGIALISGFSAVQAQYAQIVRVSTQRFENGLMIWRGDTYHVWVLTSDMTPAPGNTLTPLPTPTSPSGIQRGIAFQQYEHGFMIWWAYTGEVQIYYGASQGSTYHYMQAFYENLPDNTITDIPPGNVKPINAFGKIWGNLQDVRDGLGYAVSAEQGYTTTVVQSSFPVIHFSYDLPNGRFISESGDQWSYTEP